MFEKEFKLMFIFQNPLFAFKIFYLHLLRIFLAL